MTLGHFSDYDRRFLLANKILADKPPAPAPTPDIDKALERQAAAFAGAIQMLKNECNDLAAINQRLVADREDAVLEGGDAIRARDLARGAMWGALVLAAGGWGVVGYLMLLSLFGGLR
jgi:hypothetical protein